MIDERPTMERSHYPAMRQVRYRLPIALIKWLAAKARDRAITPSQLARGILLEAMYADIYQGIPPTSGKK